MKKIISFVSSVLIAYSMISVIPAQAEVWTPEIIKTETWTANYYIDPHKDKTLYPYLECVADIFNDGCIELKVTNTHEFDGFATIQHYVVSEYTFPNKKSWFESYESVNVETFGFKHSYIPDDYAADIKNSWGTNRGYFLTELNIDIYYTSIDIPTKHEALPNMKKGDTICYEKLIPNVEIEKEYNFMLFGHEITITPEMLKEPENYEPVETRSREDIVAELNNVKWQLTNLEQQYEDLKKQYTNLMTDYNSLKNNPNPDYNGDGLVTIADVVWLIKYISECEGLT